jgi:hypothetical protein
MQLLRDPFTVKGTTKLYLNQRFGAEEVSRSFGYATSTLIESLSITWPWKLPRYRCWVLLMPIKHGFTSFAGG